MQRIILDCDLMRYPNSGLYHYCLNLGNHINRLLEDDEDYALSLYLPHNAIGVFDKNVRGIIEKKWHQKFIKPFLWDCALWHAPFQSGRIIPKNKKVKVLLTIHDLNCLHENKPEKEIKESLAKTQQLVNRSTAIVCISEHCRKDVVENLDIGNKPIYVIHNGTHHVDIPPQKPLAYKPRRPFIFTMGYINTKKNFHTLVPLLEQENLELVVAGKLDDIQYITKMKQLAIRYHAQDRLKIVGPVSEEDKAWYLQNCLAFSLPSLAEGFGAPVVEAMAFGKPIFLSDKTSLPEIGGDVAFYFKDFNVQHMQDIFKKGMDQYNKNGLADKIKQRGQQFRWEDKAKEYLKVYKSILNS